LRLSTDATAVGCRSCSDKVRRCSLYGESASFLDGADEFLNEFVVGFVRREHDTVEAA